MLRWLALLIVAFAQTAEAKVSCDLTRIASLGGWSDPAADYWRGVILKETAERVDMFLATGQFRVKHWQMHGNTASVSNAKLARSIIIERETQSSKVRSGVVPGTEIPTYTIQSGADESTQELITVRDMAFRLPISQDDAQRLNVMTTVLIDATCKSTGNPAVAGVVYRKR